MQMENRLLLAQSHETEERDSSEGTDDSFWVSGEDVFLIIW